MRREGRPHGMVRTFHVLPTPLNPRPEARVLNKLDPETRPACGVFAKVSLKPTNHSKFTGKCERARCNECHVLPVSGKAKEKSKGAQKLKSSDAKLNYKAVTWRVMSDKDPVGRHKLPVVSGYSASMMLDELDNGDDYDDDDYEDDHPVGYYDLVRSGDHCSGCNKVHVEGNDEVEDDVVNVDDLVESVDQHDDDDEVIDDDKDDVADEDMSYCDVAILWDSVEDDEGWSLVVTGQ